MTAPHLDLSIALSDNERTRPLLEGRVAPQGIRLIPTMIHPSEMFWRQLRFAEFDVSEMSMSSLIISAARGDTRWVAIPVFTMRQFFHTSIIVRTDSGITTPAQLRGKRIGVPEYQQTWAIWSRGVAAARVRRASRARSSGSWSAIRTRAMAAPPASRRRTACG